MKKITSVDSNWRYVTLVFLLVSAVFREQIPQAAKKRICFPMRIQCFFFRMPLFVTAPFWFRQMSDTLLIAKWHAGNVWQYLRTGLGEHSSCRSIQKQFPCPDDILCLSEKPPVKGNSYSAGKQHLFHSSGISHGTENSVNQIWKCLKKS